MSENAYRIDPSAEPTSPDVAGLRFLDEDERVFWERVVCRIEGCAPGLAKKVEAVIRRADEIVLHRRERLREIPVNQPP